MKNRFLAYDLIRKGKFKTPQKMEVVEECLKNGSVVANWWCKQSGKTLTSIKIITDIAKKQNKTVTVLVESISKKTDFLSVLQKSFQKADVKRITAHGILMMNGSSIKVLVSNSETIGLETFSTLFRSAYDTSDLIIIDDFDFIQKERFESLVNIINEYKNISFIRRLLSFFIKPTKKIVLFSSKNDEINKNYLLSNLSFSSFTKLNYERLGLSKEKLLSSMSEQKFEDDYNSYK